MAPTIASAMARKCVFCGERKVSKEHVIPQWVGTVLPKPPKERWRHKEQERVWATDHLDFTVKRVCRECNNGWMDQEIERRARPALTGMIHGQDMTLTRELQARVATWAVKTHAMAQFRPTHPRPISEELRTSLYERKVAPAQSRVWLTAYAGHATHRAWARTDNMELRPAVGENVRSDNASDVEIETMTLCIGHLVLHSVKWSLERLGA